MRDVLIDAVLQLSNTALEVGLPRLSLALEEGLDIWLDECGKANFPVAVFTSVRAAERDWITERGDDAAQSWPLAVGAHRNKIWVSDILHNRRESRAAAHQASRQKALELMRGVKAHRQLRKLTSQK